MAHDFLTPAESANRRTPTNGLGQADEIWLHGIQLCYAARGNRYTSFHFVEDEQYSMAARNFTQVLKIAFIRQYNANIHQHRLSDYCRYLTFVLAQNALQRLRIIIRSDDGIVLHIRGNTLRRRNAIWAIRGTSRLDGRFRTH